MTLKQKLIKEYKDAKYCEIRYKMRLPHLTDKHDIESYFVYLTKKEAICEALARCFTEKDKKNLIPKLDAECENVAKTHFFIYDMAEESED